MKEIIATGKTLETIREKYSIAWNCMPDQLELEILEKPGVFNRAWKVRVTLDDACAEEIHEDIRIKWDGTKYIICPGINVGYIVPFAMGGRLTCKEKEIQTEYNVNRGDVFEFWPVVKCGGLSWSITVGEDACKAVARVKQEHGGRYVLAEEIPECTKLCLEQYLTWEPAENTGDSCNEEVLKQELVDKGIICGVKPNMWVEFLTVDGVSEIVVAEYTPPIPTIQPEIIDYVGDPVQEDEDEDKEDRVDFFGSKLKICKKDELLACKKLGKEGIPGVNIFGKVLPVEKTKDFSFKLKKNVYLSEDELEVRASCAGTPIRVNSFTYSVENACILQKDLDLSTGSISFPGDVLIGRDVKDGFYVYADGKVTVKGSVSGAEIKAEAGLIVKHNIITSKVSVGERHVVRSQFSQALQNIKEELESCLTQVEQLQSASGNTNTGQLLKIILEKKFPELPPKAEKLEQFLLYKDPEYLAQELEVAVRSLKHFLVGIGPLQLKNLVYLRNALKIIGNFLLSKGSLVPISVICETNYVQNSDIKCAGDFICRKGIYNSSVLVEGSVRIHGVCRGGDISCSGDIYIWELGGSGVSSTSVRVTKNSRINADFCHPNVRITVGKEVVRIDEPVQKLEIYREKGILHVEKLKWDGHN